MALALAFGAGVTYLVWGHIGTRLSVSTDIVGSTTFADFDPYRYIYRFYDIALVLPAATAFAYVLLARLGPLRVAPPARGWPPVLEETEPTSDAPSARVESSGSEEAVRIAGRDVLWALTRVGLAALTVGIEANVAHSVHGAVLTRFGIAAGLLYAGAVGGVTIALGSRRRFSSPPVRRGDHAEARGGLVARSFSTDLPVVNTFASVVVIPLLVLVSSSTTVTVASDGHVAHYSWFPAWFGVLSTAVVIVLLARAFLHADSSVARRAVERRVLLIVVVPILIFMITASLAGAQGPFQAFDDAQAMVGAKLSFWHGLWPWRDLFLLHGFLADDLYGVIGMWVFSPTRWGSNAGGSFFVVPFTIVALYGFIVYFARKNTLLIVAGTLALVLGLLPNWGGTRYVLLPIVLILFDRVLRDSTLEPVPSADGQRGLHFDRHT